MIRYLIYSLPLLLVATVAGIAVLVKPSLLHWRQPKPVEGATESYGAELRAMRDMDPCPELPIRPAEQMLVDHESLAEISKALDDFDRNVSNAISRFLRNQPKVLLRLPSSLEETGELPVVEELMPA